MRGRPGTEAHTKYSSGSAAPDSACVAVLGPTASGKSDLGLLIAEEFAGEVVNFDSVQVYRGFDIGSAKLSPDERRGIPHHLIDKADPSAEMTAGEYARQARSVMHEISYRGKLPVLVGGTGFYLRALLDGLSPAPQRNESLRRRLGSLRMGALYRYLRRFDPPAAMRIHPNDRQKLIRAVEMTMLAEKPASDIQSAPRQPLTGFRLLKIGLSPDRSMLRERLRLRTAAMFANGLIDETRALLASGTPPDAKAMQSLGYKQTLGVLQGLQTLPEAIAECELRTRQYAKRQMTWFRHELGVMWLHGFGSDPDIQREAVRLVRAFLIAAPIAEPRMPAAAIP